MNSAVTPSTNDAPCAGRPRRTVRPGAGIPPRRGLSLVESLVGVAVLSISTVGIVGPIVAANQQTRIADELTSAASLARQLLDEIGSRPFSDPDQASTLGPEFGEGGRSRFDNIDDYHGYTDQTSTLTTVDGADIAGSNTQLGYARRVVAEYRTVAAGPATPAGDFILVTVTVTTPLNETVSVYRLFSKYTRI